jgi:type IV pilus assembly protein PilV
MKPHWIPKKLAQRFPAVAFAGVKQVSNALIPSPSPAGRRELKGMTLLEVLIAILVMSFGMLGMLGLLISGLKLTTSSNYRNIASLESQAIGDLLRANSRNLLLYDLPSTTTSVTDGCLTTGGCGGSANRVDTEVALWRARLATMLPSGTGVVCRDLSLADGTPNDWQCDNSTNAAPFAVKICWDESRVPTSPAINCIQTQI